MTVVVNGAAHVLPAGASVGALVAALGLDPARPGVAVAVEGTVVPRREWPATPLDDGDRVEVVGAVQGG
ncbi:sulfur carrier protein ThiS [soil metagenome]|jgi:sulfur carrier protein|nr:sulfur carrier protein ThiS [Euzebyaceae bacterium]